jgi:hypothetical protein
MDDTYEVIRYLEPGDDNPNDATTDYYNPLHYAYPMAVQTDEGAVEIIVKFLITQALPERDNINFEYKGTHYCLPFFEKWPEVSLPPTDFLDVNMNGYQVGEAPYYLIPAIVRARRLNGHAAEWLPIQDDGSWTEAGSELLDRADLERLVTPEILLEAIQDYHRQVRSNPEVPLRLLELLDHYLDINEQVVIRQDD